MSFAVKITKQQKMNQESENSKDDEKIKVGEAPEQGSVSKRALKKQLKRKQWLDSRSERREKEKAKRKAKVEQRKAENPDLLSYSSCRKRLKKTADEKTKSDIHIAFDFSFGGLMNQRDRGKCLKQMMRCYSLNRRLDHPMHLHCTSFQGVMKDEMGRHDGYQNWDLKFHADSYVPTFADGQENPLCKDKAGIVYLTSESQNVIEGNLDPSKVYVIGGLVDHNLHKGLCHKLATEAGVSHARLPLDEHVKISTRRVLTIDHVFQIIGGVVSQKLSWPEAILKTLPARKGVEAVKKDSDVGNNEAVSECIESHATSSDSTSTNT